MRFCRLCYVKLEKRQRESGAAEAAEAQPSTSWRTQTTEGPWSHWTAEGQSHAVAGAAAGAKEARFEGPPVKKGNCQLRQLRQLRMKQHKFPWWQRSRRGQASPQCVPPAFGGLPGLVAAVLKDFADSDTFRRFQTRHGHRDVHKSRLELDAECPPLEASAPWGVWLLWSQPLITLRHTSPETSVVVLHPCNIGTIRGTATCAITSVLAKCYVAFIEILWDTGTRWYQTLRLQRAIWAQDSRGAGEGKDAKGTNDTKDGKKM